MTQKKEYRNSVRSRRLIRQAFLELLKEMEFEKITVTDISNRADLNRSTFYAHYPDIYGIVEEIQEEIINKNMTLIQEMKYGNILKNPLPYLQNISSILKENVDFFTRMGRSVNMYQYFDTYQQMITEYIINDTQIPEEIRYSSFFSIRIHFFLGGIMNSYQQWTEGNLTCTLDELSEEIASLITKSAIELLNTEWLQ